MSQQQGEIVQRQARGAHNPSTEVRVLLPQQILKNMEEEKTILEEVEFLEWLVLFDQFIQIFLVNISNKVEIKESDYEVVHELHKLYHSGKVVFYKPQKQMEDVSVREQTLFDVKKS